jgi:hypothetical protein
MSVDEQVESPLESSLESVPSLAPELESALESVPSLEPVLALSLSPAQGYVVFFAPSSQKPSDPQVQSPLSDPAARTGTEQHTSSRASRGAHWIDNMLKTNQEYYLYSV